MASRGSRARGSTSGRARIGRSGRQMIGGQEVAWEYDPEVTVDSKPQELYPEMKIPISKPPTVRERAQVERYRSVRDRFRRGPLYTILGQEFRVGKPPMSRSAAFNPFTDMPTYSDKFRPQKRHVALFNNREYDLRYFPADLRPVIDPQRFRASREAQTLKDKKRQKFVQMQIAEQEMEDREAENAADTVNDEDGEAPENASDLQDDEYSDEEGGDYNAENYFDPGTEDVDDFGAEGNEDYYD